MLSNLIDKETASKIITPLFCILTIFNLISRSTFSFDGQALKFSYVLVILIFFFSFLIIKHTLQEYIWLIIGLFITGGVFLTTGQIEYLLIIVLLFSVSQESPKKILKVILYTTIICLFVIGIFSLLNVIPNRSFYRGDIQRMSFGMHYPLVLSGYIFESSAIAAVLYGRKYPYKLSMILLVVIFILERFVNSRNDEVCIMLLIMVVLFFYIKNNTKYLAKYCLILGILIMLFIVVSVFISQIIPYNSDLFSRMNSVLSGRLQLQYTTFQYYTPRLFGIYIPQISMGGLVSNTAYYFYIDNSFCRYLFMGGILLFIFIIITFFKASINLMLVKLYLISFVELIICINGVFADPLTSLSGGLLLPMFLINVYNYRKDFGI